MKTQFASFVLAATTAALAMPASSSAQTVINPTSDGSLYVCSGCSVVSDGAYVLASGYIQGDIKFSSDAIQGPVGQAFLSVNPYGLPLWGSEVAVYGYGTAIGQLDESDADAGSYLGTLSLPAGLGFGEDAFFDVSAFVRNTHSPYLAFNLRTTGTDVFSSLEYNYGHASQLHITPVPEPTESALLMAGLAGLVALTKRRSAHRGHQPLRGL